MHYGGFKLQVQQRIIKTSHEMPGDKPWKRWKTKNVSHYWNGPPLVPQDGLFWLSGGSPWRFQRLAST